MSELDEIEELELSITATEQWKALAEHLSEQYGREVDPAELEQVDLVALAETMQWYADPQNWKDVVGKYPPKTSWGALDGGQKARQALASLPEKKP